MHQCANRMMKEIAHQTCFDKQWVVLSNKTMTFVIFHIPGNLQNNSVNLVLYVTFESLASSISSKKK